tara:strand:+ start:1698 stop:2018 length:321 start_codon:yes stop_codon:yes gene_type:complete
LAVYAIIQSGGRQVRVSPGTLVTIDRVPKAAGQEISFDRVLLIGKDGGEIVTGSPYVTDASVVGVVDAVVRGPKIRVFQKKRRKGMRRTLGHRSVLTRVRVKDIRA